MFVIINNHKVYINRLKFAAMAPNGRLYTRGHRAKQDKMASKRVLRRLQQTSRWAQASAAERQQMETDAVNENRLGRIAKGIHTSCMFNGALPINQVMPSDLVQNPDGTWQLPEAADGGDEEDDLSGEEEQENDAHE